MNVGLLSWRTRQNSKHDVVTPILANSIEHETRKLHICYYLRRLGLPFYAEVVFANEKGRADIYIPSKELAIEVLESEEEASFELKKLKYPCRVVAVRKDFIITIDTIEKLVN